MCRNFFRYKTIDKFTISLGKTNKIFIFICLICYSIVLYGDDIYEPNNTFANAHTIDKGTYHLSAQNEDWFKIYLKPGALQLSMTPSSNIDINMVLYNDNRQVVASHFSSGTENIAYKVASAGYYYIQILPTSNMSTNYVLSINYTSIADDAYEPNDTFLEAKPIDKGTYHLSAQNEDWFKISLKVGELKLSMTPSSNIDVNMALYDKNQKVVAAHFSTGTENIVYDVVSSGDYYIKISPASSISTSYSLSIDYTSLIVWQKELEFGPIRDVSVALFDIDKDGKDEIFVGTSKGLDANLNEIRPAGLICLEANGTVKWSRTFPAMDTPDPQTGKMYKTTSVSSTPFFSDIDNDGEMDIIVGVGADTFGEAGKNVVGQPGDKGGVYALDSKGNIKWFHQSLDTIGGDQNTGDGRPDGVYGTPIVYDIDKDGVKDVIYNSWDQSMWILDARTGKEKLHVHLDDTIWSTPKIADINEDGNFDILVSADITENADAGTTTGGIFHVISSNGKQNIQGFNQPVGNANYLNLRGKAEEQSLWSSPITADLDNDGHLEIIYGTGNFFHDDRGEYIRVWNHDGTEKFKLSTIGRTFSTPLVADINNDGYLEILATTLKGYLFCWDHNGNQLFATQTLSYKATSADPIFSSPIAVDINNDGKLEIIYAQGAQIVIVNSLGEQISNNNKREMIFEQFKGSPAVKDVDNDGVLDLISGGTNTAKDKAVVYRWKINGDTKVIPNYKIAKYQLIGSNTKIEDFVKRFYNEVLARDAEPGGLIYWTDELVTGVKAGSDVARGFIFSQEFTNRNTDDDTYLNILYRAFFNREPDGGGFSMWQDKMSKGATRSEILDGFLFSPEFSNLCKSYNIIPVK